MYELRLRVYEIANRGAYTLNGGTRLRYPRSYTELRSYARRHPSHKARQAVEEIENAVRESGWTWVKRSGGKSLEVFYRSTTEVFNEVATAVLGIEFESGPGNSLIARWEFRFPVEDVVLNLLHRRYPLRRLVLLTGDKAFIRDGCGVRMEKLAGAAAIIGRRRDQPDRPARSLRLSIRRRGLP